MAKVSKAAAAGIAAAIAGKSALSAGIEPGLPPAPAKEAKNAVSVDPVSLLIAFASKEIGNKEIPAGSNWGKHVRKYLAAVKIAFPAPWCMAFVQWCIDQVLIEINKPGDIIHRSGHVMTVWNYTGKEFKIPGDQIKPGDIFILSFKGGAGHTGIVIKTKPGMYLAIEGNSNATGSREGIEVCTPKWRKISDAKGFLRVF